MRAMRDSGVPWIGEVPEGWEVHQLGRIAPLVSVRGAYEKSIPYIALENIESWSGKVLATEEQKEVESTVSFCEAGDVLFGKLRPYLAKVVQVKTSCACSSELLVLRPKRVEGRFLFYLLINKRFIGVAESVSYGAKMPRASWGDLRYVPLPLPPLPEQRRIAGWLDERCADIDAAVEAARASIDEYEAYKKSVISHAVTRGLDPDTPLKDTGIPWLGQIPEGWEVARVGSLLNEKKGRSEDGVGEPLSITIARGVLRSSELKIPNPPASYVGAKLAAKGDLVFNRLKAHLGVFGLAPCDGLVSPDYAVFAARESNVCLAFYAYLFSTPRCIDEFKLRITGVAEGLRRLYTPQLFSIKVPLPPLPEQQAIAAYLDSRTAAIDAVVGQKRAIVEDLLAYKKSLIYEAVTGKREV